MIEVSSDESGLSVSRNWALWAIEHLLDLKLVIVVEQNISCCLVMSIQSDCDVINHVSLSHKGLESGQTWGLADNCLAVNDGCVHPSCSIEDTECSVESHINEILSLKSDLGSSIGWSARRLHRDKLRSFIVKEWETIGF